MNVVVPNGVSKIILPPVEVKKIPVAAFKLISLAGALRVIVPAVEVISIASTAVIGKVVFPVLVILDAE